MSERPEHGYWRSLAELAKDPRYAAEIADEFGPHGPNAPDAPDAGGEPASGMSRRRFMALLGASAALGAAGCGRFEDRGEIEPYATLPEGVAPGRPVYYASTLTSYPGAPPVLVLTREGRPIVLQGNQDHPGAGEFLGSYGQSATLSLYDPERAKAPRRGNDAATWDVADGEIRRALAQANAQGKRIVLVTRPLVSPTARALVREFLAAYSTARHLPIDTFPGAATTVAWGNADVIVGFDADFIGPCGKDANARGFASRRRPESPGGMSRFWAVEGPLTLTGTNADHRIRLRTARHGILLLGILNEVAKRTGAAGDARALAPYELGRVIRDLGLDERLVRAMAKDLVEHRGRSAVLAGDHQPPEVHALVAALNAALGNVGTAVVPAPSVREVASPEAIAAIANEMAAGNVAVVLSLGANPVYELPADVQFGARLERVPLVVAQALAPDETSARARYVLPLAHDLESWGDSDALPGAIGLQQPAIRPLFDARQIEDSLLRWLPAAAGLPAMYHDYLRARWEREVYAARGLDVPFAVFWDAALHDGFIRVDTPPPPAATPGPAVAGEIAAHIGRETPRGFDVVLMPSASTWDGRFANNGWLLELPHPVTSQVWGNGAIVGPATAERLGAGEGALVRVTIDGRSIELPVVIQPGYADDVVGIELGWGRTVAGEVGKDVGVDANALRTLRGGLYYAGATVEKIGGESRIVRTQEHHNIPGERQIVYEGTLDEYKRNPGFVGREAFEDSTVKSPGNWQYTTQKWGMAIDMSVCVGCNGCMVACTAENNVPVVGPDQVAKNREMHWLRIDSYYHGDADDPQVVHQPMLCQHCDNAPCEYVCPVAATAHSPDGLNEMVYNRCVGTRYCGNNCPYKVRRFNYFDWHERNGGLISPKELLFNPEVTVRSRGVMEKCTFCVQRIRIAQENARTEGRSMVDGEVRTACQQACPTDAIVFGDLNDPKSRVNRLSKDPRGYSVLGMLGTRPAITYLAKIRNPHPDLVA